MVTQWNTIPQCKEWPTDANNTDECKNSHYVHWKKPDHPHKLRGYTVFPFIWNLRTCKLIDSDQQQINGCLEDFLGGSVVKNHLPLQETGGRFLIGEDPTCHGAAELVSHTTEPVKPGTRSFEPTCHNDWSPRALPPALHSKRSHWNEKPVYHN